MTLAQARSYSLLGFFAASIVVAVLGTSEGAPTVTRSDPAPLRYEHGAVTGRLESVPLGQVLAQLEEQTGLRARLIDPASESWPVSAVLQATPLERAVRKILDGFSYVLQSGPEGLEVIVLAAPRRTAATTVEGADSGSARAPAGASRSERARSPQTLDDLAPIAEHEGSPSAPAKEAGTVNPTQPQRYNEAMLHRALDALRTDQKGLHVEAMKQLATLDDPRAAEALREVVLRTAADDAEHRFQAVSALVQHAELTQFGDRASVTLLQQLARDHDGDVRGLAVEALAQKTRSEATASAGIGSRSEPGQSPPRTLDDLAPIAEQEGPPRAAARGTGNEDRAVNEPQPQRYNEALLQRALDALRTEHTGLHLEAMKQLATLSDPRATDALREAVSRMATEDSAQRFQAVSALVQHAEQTRFSDRASVALLQELARDKDVDVRSLAGEALSQMPQPAPAGTKPSP